MLEIQLAALRSCCRCPLCMTAERDKKFLAMCSVCVYVYACMCVSVHFVYVICMYAFCQCMYVM